MGMQKEVPYGRAERTSVKLVTQEPGLHASCQELSGAVWVKGMVEHHSPKINYM